MTNQILNRLKFDILYLNNYEHICNLIFFNFNNIYKKIYIVWIECIIKIRCTENKIVLMKIKIQDGLITRCVEFFIHIQITNVSKL